MRWTRGAAVHILFAGLLGCGTIGGEAPQPEPVSQDEVGAVHLSVVSLAPWSDYVESLQPHFELNADEALHRVVRTSGLRRRLETDAAALSIGAQQAGSTATAPDATALYQEVQLLNRYVFDAAIPNGYVPFVVRLQLTLLPRYRGAPYDAYSSISFFTTGPRRLNETVWARTTKEDAEVPPEIAGSAPRVLPLLVTDNLEAALATDEYERSRRLALSAAGTAGTTMVGVGAERSKGLTEQSAGLDLNSLLTVTRLSENTLRVRLGAMQQGSSRFAMVPRTHKITLLVMVPQGAQAALQVVSRTELVHAETGRTLQPRTESRIAMMKAELGELYGISSQGLTDRLLDLAQQNAQREFLALAQSQGIERPHLLWVDTVGLLSGGQYSSSVVDLDGPRVEIEPSPPPVQTVYLLDDGTRIVGELVGGKHLTLEPLEMELHIGDKTLPVVRVIPVEGGRALRFECRSLHKHGIDPASMRIRLRMGDEMIDYEQVEYRRPKPVKPAPKRK
jgi:hypothetical protein